MNDKQQTERAFYGGAATLALALLAMVPAPATGQSGAFHISQRATISQKIADTKVSLDYSRPLVRGRSDLFGKVVHWGEVWTPGANEATTLELSQDAKLNGHDVPAGRWSVWIIPSQVGLWEFLLDPRDSLHHTQRPQLDGEGQIRFPIEYRQVDHVEALTWSFPRVERGSATLQMAWGTTMVSLELEVDPAMPVTTIEADQAALYVGEWEVTPSPHPETGQAPPPTTLQVRFADSTLVAEVPPGTFIAPPANDGADEAAELSPIERERTEARRLLAEYESAFTEYLLVPKAHGIFLMGWIVDGLLVDVEEVYHEFEFENGRAVRLTIRGENDQVFATATRIE